MLLKREFLLFVFYLVILTGTACSKGIKLQTYDGGFFSIKIPSGWQIYTAGQCGEFAFVVRDAAAPMNQIFYFGSVGPVYLSAQQKQIDMNYMQMGGYPVAWIEMPVVEPFTPAEFLKHFNEIARTQIAQQFLPQAPQLENFTVISEAQQTSGVYGGTTALVRALFTENGKVGEGLFLCTVAPYMPFTGGPGGGNGYGFLVCGVTADKRRFAEYLPFLEESMASFTVSPAYVQQCLQNSRAVWQQVIKNGQTLSETSDMIMAGWESRNKSQDIIAEKRSDAILGYDRVYNPETDETYQVDPQFWDDYQLNRDAYEFNNLQIIPNENYELWNRAPKSQQEIR